ncbi:MAG: hypothetical protein V1726_04265 [Methanobacteriota archaeon]
MTENKEQLKRFYEDAVYLHLIHKGFSEDKARNIAVHITEQHLVR